MKAHLTMRLRLVATVDFRHGVRHHVEELRRQKRLIDLRAGEVILLISFTGLQLAFVYPEREIHGRRDTVKALAHYRVQLDRHSPWTPKMLAEYAGEAGIVIEGVRQFEEHLSEAVRDAA